MRQLNIFYFNRIESANPTEKNHQYSSDKQLCSSPNSILQNERYVLCSNMLFHCQKLTTHKNNRPKNI